METVLHLGWRSRRAFGLTLVLSQVASAQPVPSDAATTPEATEGRTQPQVGIRMGVEWGTLWAPLHVDGQYLRPDGSANVTFHAQAPSRELIGGRFEVGAATWLPHGQGLFGRVGLLLGGSPVQTHSVVVTGVPLEYQTQQMFFAAAGGVEYQFEQRVFGVGLDVGYATSWDPGRHTTPEGLDLTVHGSSGPYARLSMLTRLPWKGLLGVGLFAAFDGFLTFDGSVGADSRASMGAVFELDASR